jgi:hypothetical protein
MTDRDTTTRTRARAPGVGGVFHRMAVHDRVLRPDSERTTVATTKCTKGGCKLDGGRRMPGAGLSRRSPRKAPLGQSAFQPYWGKLAVRNDRGDRGNVGIIRSPIRASILPDHLGSAACIAAIGPDQVLNHFPPAVPSPAAFAVDQNQINFASKELSSRWLQNSAVAPESPSRQIFFAEFTRRLASF